MEQPLATFAFNEVKTTSTLDQGEIAVTTPAVTIHQEGRRAMVVTLESLPPELYDGSLKNEMQAQKIVSFLCSDMRSPWVVRHGHSINSSNLAIKKPNRELKHSEVTIEDTFNISASKELIITPATLTHIGSEKSTGNSLGFSSRQLSNDGTDTVGFSEFTAFTTFNSDSNIELERKRFLEISESPEKIVAFLMTNSAPIGRYIEHLVDNPNSNGGLIIDGKNLDMDTLEKGVELYYDGLEASDIIDQQLAADDSFELSSDSSSPKKPSPKF